MDAQQFSNISGRETHESSTDEQVEYRGNFEQQRDDK